MTESAAGYRMGGKAPQSCLPVVLALLLCIGMPARSGGSEADPPSQGEVRGAIPSGSLRAGPGDPEDRAGWERWEGVPQERSSLETRCLVLTAGWWIRGFRKIVSPVDGPSCSFYPTCSAYGMQAVRKHGLLAGIPMTAERVMRDHRPHNPDRYPLIERDDSLYYQDPVEANDFWWSPGP